MAVAFPFSAVWGEPVRESLAWKTRIGESQTAAEQRRAHRTAPRRSLTADLVLDRSDKAFFDQLMHGPGAGELYVPIWHDAQLTPAPAAAGTKAIYCSTAYRDFAAGRFAILRGEDARSFEVVTIDGVLADRITTTTPLAQTWPARTRLFPVRLGRFLSQPQPRVKNDRLWTVPLTLRLIEPCDWPTLALPMYRSHPVYEVAPDWTEDLSAAYKRFLKVLDNDIAAPHVVDTAGSAFTLQSHRWVMDGAAEHDAFRRLLYTLRGRQVSVWMPTHQDDLWLTSTLPALSVLMQVENVGFTAYGYGRPGRRDVRIQLGNGTVFHRRITSSAVVSSSVEQIGIDAPLGVSVAPREVLRISFLRLVRSDDDQVEIQHQTDIEGVAEASISFRSLRDEL